MTLLGGNGVPVFDRHSLCFTLFLKVDLSMGLLLLIILVVLLMGGLPTWNHSRNWGYGPSSGVGFLLVVGAGVDGRGADSPRLLNRS